MFEMKHAELALPCAILAAAALDLAIGDPQVKWHPVRLVGRWIERAERFLRRMRMDGRGGGIALVVSTLCVCGLPVIFVRVSNLSPMIEFAADTVILYFSIALGALLREGRGIRIALESDSPQAARAGVSHLCGRDVDRLDNAGLSRATVESLAENSVDGYTAPLFYAALLGPAGAWLYRIANTLDSMVGYKNEKYIRFGWAAARLDDVLNFIPARLTALLLSLCSPVARGSIAAGLRSMWIFSGRHPSPNAGWTESAAAGALGLRLGGPAFYFGKEVDKPYLGEGLRPAVPHDILLTGRLVLSACMTFVLLTCAALYALSI